MYDQFARKDASRGLTKREFNEMMKMAGLKQTREIRETWAKA
jgi:hypothetical protein